MGPSPYYGAYREDPHVRPFVELAFGKRPTEQLFHLKSDPYNLTNLANDPEHADIENELKQRLHGYLERTGDPRANGKSADFSKYEPFTAEVRKRRAKEIRQWRKTMQQMTSLRKKAQRG